MSLTYEELRYRCDAMSDELEDWQGIPVPLPGNPVTLHDRHPLRERMERFSQEVDGTEMEFVCGGPDVREDEFIRNQFFSRKTNAMILIYQQGDKVFHIKSYRSLSMERLRLWITTIGASDAWDLDAEYTAREKLRGMLSDRQWRHYELTGSFFEPSARSRLTYVFRRLRPTIVLSSRNKPGSIDDSMRCIAVLCMHPIGYYSESWAGCMVPTDDVIAHLLYMRSDEAGYWGQANQHPSWTPEAGL